MRQTKSQSDKIDHIMSIREDMCMDDMMVYELRDLLIGNRMESARTLLAKITAKYVYNLGSIALLVKQYETKKRGQR